MQAHYETRDFAKHLRRRLSPPEAVLWRAIKGGKAAGLKFRKQHPIGPYVLDFYCHEARLCVEVDGAGHGFGRQPQKDERRDRWLADKGVRTLRLRAGYVLEEIDGAVAMIVEAAREAAETSERKPPPSASLTPPPVGEDWGCPGPPP